MLIEDILDGEDKRKQAPDPLRTNDKGWGKTADQTDTEHSMPLSQVRKLRLLRDKNRKEMVKRMLLLKQMYAAPPAGGGMGF